MICNTAYRLVHIREEDILKIKQWRNEQINILRQKKPLTDEEQIKYYKNVIQPTISQEHPEQILFSYLHQDRCIGYGGLTHIDWDYQRAEVSFLLETARNHDISQFQKEFGIFLEFLKRIAFDDLKLHRLYTETYDIRPYVIETLEKKGFRFEGRLKDHVKIDGKFVDSVIHGC